MPKYITGDPRNEQQFPKTTLAADSRTRLYRYRVDAVVYAPSIDCAYQMVGQAWWIDAAKVERA